MKVTYNRKLKELVIDGEGDLILVKNGKPGITVKGAKEYEEDSEVQLHIENFWFKSTKPTLKEKIKCIITILTY